MERFLYRLHPSEDSDFDSLPRLDGLQCGEGIRDIDWFADIGLHEFRRQLQHKARLYGAELVTASRWFPSRTVCCECGIVAEELPLSMREWRCGCGARSTTGLSMPGGISAAIIWIGRVKRSNQRVWRGRLWREVPRPA